MLRLEPGPFGCEHALLLHTSPLAQLHVPPHQFGPQKLFAHIRVQEPVSKAIVADAPGLATAGPNAVIRTRRHCRHRCSGKWSGTNATVAVVDAMATDHASSDVHTSTRKLRLAAGTELDVQLTRQSVLLSTVTRAAAKLAYTASLPSSSAYWLACTWAELPEDMM